MKFATTIAEKFVGLISAPVGQEIGYPFSYKTNVDKLRAEVQKLTDDWTDKERIVGEAKRNNEDIAAAVQDWLNRAEVAIAEANGLINKDHEGQGEVRFIRRQFPNLRVRRRLSKDAEKMAQKVSEITAEGRSHPIIFFPLPPQMINSSSARGYEALESRMSILNDIKQALKDPNINMIGVHGMGGVGKTTLMEELACQAKTERLFEVVVMVTSITNTPDFRRIQGQLADGLGLELRKETEKGRAGELRGRISNEMSILVILDDIWDELKLGDLGVPYGHKGCKLVLTSRDLNVLKKMKTEKDFLLEVFSEGESWNLFEKIAGDVVKPQNIKSIAVDVVKCCAGLPLLIDIVAKDLIRESDVLVWKDTLTRLRSSPGHYDDKVKYILKLSYERLKCEELKSLFLLIGSCGQVGIGIHAEELLQVCWGLGVYSVRTLAQARARQHALIKFLRASSLLLDGEVKWVRMHDLVHDVAKSIASENHCTYIGERLTKINEWPRNDQLQNYHRIILRDYRISELPEKLECPNLELLHFNGMNYLKIPDNFFSKMGEKVKVLYLPGMEELTNTPPPSLHCLVGLRSLNLAGSVLQDIAIIGKLTNLQILILEGVQKLVKLPREIGDLTDLRMLNFSNCPDLRFIAKNTLSRLTCLEELYMMNCWDLWTVDERDSALRSLELLTTLELRCRDSSIFPGNLNNLKLERFKICIGGGPSVGVTEFSRTLSLEDSPFSLEDSPCTTIVSDDGVQLLLKKVESLYLGKLRGVTNILPEVNEGRFEKLSRLRIRGNTELLRIIHGHRLRYHLLPAFPDLEALELLRLPNVVEICHGPLPPQSFGMLKVIRVDECNKMETIFLCSHLKHLPQLQKMKIAECQSIRAIIAQDREEIHEIQALVLPKLHSLILENLPALLGFCSEPHVPKAMALFDEKVAMPNLETMMLYEINTCKIWDDNVPAHSCIQNLTQLVLDGCVGLTSLFPPSVARALEKLQYLYIRKCQTLEQIFVQDENQDQVILPNLETLVIYELVNLKLLWRGQLRSGSFCKLNSVKISECFSMEKIFASEDDATIEITFMKLEKLELEYLSSLTSFCGGNCSVNFPSLKTVRVVGCYMMKTRFEKNLTAPSLKYVSTGYREEGQWDGDLNTTKRNIFAEEEKPRKRYKQCSSLQSFTSEDEGNSSSSCP